MLLVNQAWSSISAAVASLSSRAERFLNDHHSTDSILGRTWPTGTMAFWATIMLGGYLVLFYFRG